ncbi:nucleotidyltransferase family protein [Anoxynatronum sibiricum]|uniref:Nucleotidyltransferase family protein n=1 Tax=Anoxynatronum sibiricum TaxID=210623 RepID=A0ABU9VPE9_9CLOT
MISAILLASGYGTRMKQPKLLLPVEGVPMIRRVAQAVKASCVDESLLIYRENQVKEAVAELVSRSVFNSGAHQGQSEAIKLGIRHLHPASHACFFVMGDQPLIQPQIFNQLIREHEQQPQKIIVPVYQGKRGSPVLFPSEFWPLLLQLSGDQGGRVVMESHGKSVVLIDVEDSVAGKDVDTWESYVDLTEKLKSVK